MVIDDSVINWAIGTLAVGIPATGTTVVVLWNKLLAFLSPKITNAFNAHTALVEAMKENVPVVATTMNNLSNTMTQISATQEAQRETLELHTKLDTEHSDKLEALMQISRKGTQ